ncbi:MAG: hypothetical protein ACYC1U_11420 [Candidatus Aquicultorales bacterium]
MNFKKPQVGEYLYPQYKLRFNPFVVETDTVEAKDEEAGYRNFVYGRESKRVVAGINSWIEKGETSKVWIVKDMSVHGSHHIYLSGGILRHLMADEEDLRIFPALSLLTVIYKAAVDNILKMVLDRLTIDQFRLCLFSYIYQCLEKLVDQGVDKQAITDVDVPAFLAKIEATGGEILDWALYGRPEEEKPERQAAEVLEETQTSEADASEALENEEVEKEDPEAAAAKKAEEERLAALRQAAERAVQIESETTSLQHLGKEAVGRGMVSLEDGFSFLKVGGFGLDAMNDVLNLMSSYYRTTFVLIDRIDGWAMLEDEEKRRIYAELGEWQWVIGSKGCLGLVAGPLFAEATDPSFLATAFKIETYLRDVERPIDRLVTAEEGAELVGRYLAAAGADDDGSIAPFTPEAIDEMVERAEGNIAAFLTLAGQALAKAAGKGAAAISAGDVPAVRT